MRWSGRILKTDGGLQRRARCMQRHVPGLVADDAIRGDAAPSLKRLHRRLGIGAKVAVYDARRGVPLAGCSVCKDLLQAADHRAGRAFVQRWHRRAARKRGPGLRPDNAVNGKTSTLLELLDGSFSRRPKNAVDNETKVWRSAQCPLEPANHIAGRTGRNSRLTRIWYGNPLLLEQGAMSAAHIALVPLRQAAQAMNVVQVKGREAFEHVAHYRT